MKLKSIPGLEHATKLRLHRVRRAAKHGIIGISGRVVGKGMREAEEHTGIGARHKASYVRCSQVHRVRRAAKYAIIGIFELLVGREMREAEEHKGVGARDKASRVKC